MKNWLTGLAVVIGFFVIGGVCFLLGMQNGNTSILTIDRTQPRGRNESADGEISFVGYIRGRSQTTLKNKYAGFVSKVRVYSQRRVKKGDVIIEYDDHTLRTSIDKISHNIAEQEKVLEKKKLNLVLTRIDPLPSEFRNLVWKRKIAQENLERSAHEYQVYQRLHGSKIVTDLAYREKKEAFKNREAEVKKMDEDMKILEKGLADYNVKSAEIEVAEAETKLKDLQEELVLLKEEQKYYKITAPYDGCCITNSDTVGGYDTAGTAAVEVHRDDRKLLYAYCPERYIRYVREGVTYRFISNQYPDDKQGFEMKCYEIKKARYQYGDESFFLIKCRVVKEPNPLRIGSIGSLVVEKHPEKPEPAQNGKK